MAPISPMANRRRKSAAAPRRRRTGILGPEDAFWKLIGIGHSGLSDVSANKQAYLADAYYPPGRRPVPPGRPSRVN